MSEATNALLLPGEFTWKGKRYQFAPMDTLEVRARYEDWMIKEAWAELKRCKPHLPAEEYAEQAAGLRRDITAKLYRWGGMVWAQTFGSVAGQKQVLLFMLRMYHPDIDAAWMDELYDGGEVAETVIKTMLEAEGSDPNRRTPARHPSPATTPTSAQ